jgi:hypothetical protein
MASFEVKGTSLPINWALGVLQRWSGCCGKENHFSAHVLFQNMDRDSSVGIVTHYRLDGPGIEFRWGRDIPHTSRPALGPTEPSHNGYRIIPGDKAAGAWGRN